MVKLGSLFVSVTWGAGGSTADKSLDLAQFVQELGVPTCLHLTCTNMDRAVLNNALEQAKKIGIRNILALRGDPPREEEYWEESGAAGDDKNESEFLHAVDLVRYIKKHYGDYFSVGVAGYPEGHAEGAGTLGQDPKNDLPYLVEKVEAGADFIITQLFYDVDKFVAYEKLLRESDSARVREIPILPGLMPINTYQSFVRASKLSHASVPPKLLGLFNEIPNGNDEKVKELGVNVLSNIVSRVYQKTDGRIRGFHFYTLNLEKSVALILEQCPVLTLPSSRALNARKALERLSFSSGESSSGSLLDATEGEFVLSTPTDVSAAARRRSSVNAHNRLIVSDLKSSSSISGGGGGDNAFLAVPEAEAGHSTDLDSQQTEDILAISTGEGALGREANWDDFPNGRFGDSRSPAYGEIDGYGPSLHVDTARAYKLWGHPATEADISALFRKHLTGQLDALPWSDVPLNPETMLIQEELLQLNARGGLWTVASQPACNAARSEDKFFGWGPAKGRVFQKPFVEMFASPREHARLVRLATDERREQGSFTVYACNGAGELVTRIGAAPDGGATAVTWGVFPNREILQSTLIEEDSFQSWGEEAFSIWREWRRLFRPGSKTHALLDRIVKEYVLVTVVYHDYMSENALWEILLED